MTGPAFSLPPFVKGLSARLLVLTVAFVMLSEVLIYVPSIARFRLTLLEERIDAAHLASLALKAAPDNMVSHELEKELLANAQVEMVALKQPETRTLMLGVEPHEMVAASYDLRDPMPLELIIDAFRTLLGGERIIRVIGNIPGDGVGYLEVVVDEGPVRAAMIDYSTNILNLSIVISLLTATLVFVSLHILMVRPMRRITESMAAFRSAPESADSIIAPTARSDEIGTAQRELARMQEELRAALRQKTRLAALGATVAKINHDLRNILATAHLVSDRLAVSEDPKVRQVTPRLVRAIDRAIDLCTETLNFGRAEERPPRRTEFPLAELVDEIGLSIGLSPEGGIGWRNEVAGGFRVTADREQLFRVLLNLGRNAVQAMSGRESGEVRITAERRDHRVEIDVADTGPGLPQKARDHLFQPFAGSARAEGTGLGLYIARDLLRGHGGDIALWKSDDTGTVFRISLPDGPTQGAMTD